MSGALTTILLVLSVLIIIAIFMQPTKNQSSNVFDASSNDLFERSKARGFEAVMQRLTAIMIFFSIFDEGRYMLFSEVLLIITMAALFYPNFYGSLPPKGRKPIPIYNRKNRVAA